MITKEHVLPNELPQRMSSHLLGRPASTVNHTYGTAQEKKDRSSLLVKLNREVGAIELARMIRDKEI